MQVKEDDSINNFEESSNLELNQFRFLSHARYQDKFHLN